MKLTMRFWTAALALAVALPAQAAQEEFDADKLIGDLEQQLRLKKEEYDRLKPELEQTLSEKSRTLKESIHETVDKGFVELESMTKELSAATEQAEAKLQEALNSEQMQELKDYLGKVDKQAIEQARQELINELTEMMELSAEQIEKIKPVLQDTIDKQSELLRRFVADTERSFDEFRKEYEALGQDTQRRLQEFLDSEQMEKLKKRLEEIRENIRSKVFAQA